LVLLLVAATRLADFVLFRQSFLDASICESFGSTNLWLLLAKATKSQAQAWRQLIKKKAPPFGETFILVAATRLADYILFHSGVLGMYPCARPRFTNL
jgi:hypothetical protein